MSFVLAVSVWNRTPHVRIRTLSELKSKELCLGSSCLIKGMFSGNNMGLDRIRRDNASK